MSTLPPALPDHDTDDGPLLLQPLVPTTDGLNRTVVLGAVGLLLVGVFGAAYYALQQRNTTAQPPPHPATETTSMAGVNPPLESFIKVPTTFAGLDRRPPATPEPPPPPVAPIPPM